MCCFVPLLKACDFYCLVNRLQIVKINYHSDKLLTQKILISLYNLRPPLKKITFFYLKILNPMRKVAPIVKHSFYFCSTNKLHFKWIIAFLANLSFLRPPNMDLKLGFIIFFFFFLLIQIRVYQNLAKSNL